MPIDTVAKRKSVINNGLPGLALLPPPDALIQAVDRRRLADFYSLGSQVIARNFWVPDRREVVLAWDTDNRVAEPTWKQDDNATQNFAPDKRTSTTWQQDQDSPGDWREESEVSLE